MPTVRTIGYEKKPLSALIGELRAAGVDAVIDVRLRNTSHLREATADRCHRRLIAKFWADHIPGLSIVHL